MENPAQTEFKKAILGWLVDPSTEVLQLNGLVDVWETEPENFPYHTMTPGDTYYVVILKRRKPEDPAHPRFHLATDARAVIEEVKAVLSPEPPAQGGLPS